MKKINSKKYFQMLEEAENEFYDRVGAIEILMQADTGIEDISFFQCDGSYVGIGNESRTLKLIPRS